MAPPNVLLLMVDQLAAGWLPAYGHDIVHAPRVGVYDNAAELRASAPTVTHRLRAAGYDTCLSGKMHFVGPDQLHGFEQRLTTDVYPADLDWTPDWRLPASERLPWYHNLGSVTG